MLEGSLNWLSDPIYAILLDTSQYQVSPHHASLADVPQAAFIASSSIFTGRTTVNGVADADDAIFGPVKGNIIEALIIVKDGGTALQSKLIAYIDTAMNLPHNPDGRNLTIVWDNGNSKIFAL